MIPLAKRLVGLLFPLLLASCNLDARSHAVPASPAIDFTVIPSSPLPQHQISTPADAPPAVTAAPTQVMINTEPAPAATPSEASTLALPRALPEEAILILSPGPGSRLTNPIRVTGVAGPVLDQSLSVRVISMNGQELAIAPAQIDAEAGQRGLFSVDLAISVNEVQPAFLQVYTASPVDGGILHLTAIGVTLAPRGASDLKPVNSYLERITIDQPAPGETIRGGILRVQGFGQASFEQTLIVEIVGPDGTIIGSQSFIVGSSEPGKPGLFSVEVPYTAASGPGRIVVRDPSPSFQGNIHITSVEVKLEP